MGTWGEGAFENDTAADWAGEFADADLESGMRLIEAALGRAAATPADAYLRRRDGDLAAAELVDERVHESAYNGKALDWADREDAEAGPALLDLARQALTRVTADGSESADLWDEEPSTWRESIAELAAKLQDASSS